VLASRYRDLDLADKAPGAGLAPADGTFERSQLQEWFNYISTKIHKGFGLDIATWPNLAAYQKRVGARPKVQEALKAEGLIK